MRSRTDGSAGDADYGVLGQGYSRLRTRPQFDGSLVLITARP
jgi:hypothetical protein